MQTTALQTQQPSRLSQVRDFLKFVFVSRRISSLSVDSVIDHLAYLRFSLGQELTDRDRAVIGKIIARRESEAPRSLRKLSEVLTVCAESESQCAREFACRCRVDEACDRSLSDPMFQTIREEISPFAMASAGVAVPVGFFLPMTSPKPPATPGAPSCGTYECGCIVKGSIPDARGGSDPAAAGRSRLSPPT